MTSPADALLDFSAVIVTGGSSGIGKSFIELCFKLRPDLVFCNLSRRIPELAEKELKLRHFACDLGRPEQIETAAAAIEALLDREAPAGRVLLINNSGFGTYGRFPDPSLGQNGEMVDVNVRAVVHLTGRLMPFLKSRGGAILTVASTAAFQPTPYLATYGATKAFVLHWSLALNEELRGTGVRTLALCPGPTATQFFRRAGLKEGSVADALGQSSGDVVREALVALGAGRCQVVTGWKNKVSAFFGGMLPKPLTARVAGIVLKRYRLAATSK